MITWIILWFLHQCVAQVSVGFPFNEQLPTVARLNEAYSFTMANSTYKSSLGSQIYYEVSDLPSWLLFDSGSRTFTGTPQDQDVGEFDVSITGTDQEDSLTNTYSMIVSNDTGLDLSSPGIMFAEISRYGKTNGADGLVVSEGQDINIQFDKSVFESKSNSNRSIVAYYGRSADRSSLPNWISFDPDNLSFSGKVPHVTSDSAPSYEYGFSFIASDYYGFAGAEGLFSIVVGGHQLSTNINHTIKINGSLDDEFDVKVPVTKNVFLDGVTIAKENISAIYGNDLPDYASFNQETYQLTGTFPDETSNDTFSIVIRDIYGNSVELPYSFNAMGSIFTVTSLPDVNATRGEFFEYQLMDSMFTNINETEVSVSFDADWLSYDEGNMTLYGNVPDEFDDVDVSVQATNNDISSRDLVAREEDTMSFGIKGVDADTSSSSSQSESSTASESSSDSASSSGTGSSASDSTSSESAGAGAGSGHDDDDDDFRKKLAIGLGVGIPLFLILIAAIILLCCCVKRRKNSDKDEEKSGDTTLEEEEVNGPGFGIIKSSPKDVSGNAKKLDDIQSTSSSMTHVDHVSGAAAGTAAGVAGVAAGAAAIGATKSGNQSDNESDEYFDASNEKPVKSWRANDQSDMAAASGGLTKSGNIRKSDASLSTVNTEQLFSVRLVEDQSILRNSQNSSFGSGQFISNNSLNALLNREDSGNIQRLDSDGNIVDNQTTGSFSPRKPVSRSPSGNLEVLVENSNENTRDYSTDYHSMTTKQSKQSLYDDFKATQTGDGNFDWIEDSNNNSKDSEYQFLNTGKPLNMALSDNSLGSQLSAERPENPSRISSSSLGKKAKLVDFTRRSSLRESAHNLNYTYEGETVLIHNDSP